MLFWIPDTTLWPALRLVLTKQVVAWGIFCPQLFQPLGSILISTPLIHLPSLMFIPYCRRTSDRWKAITRARETEKVSRKYCQTGNLQFQEHFSSHRDHELGSMDLLEVYRWGSINPLNFQAKFFVINIFLWKLFTVYKGSKSSKHSENLISTF